ncbi:pantoate kinase [Methanolobus sp. ZRKC3]|uniref:pantoate kinase n=1 Tax=Methanolobus sp. ZRKC3 TaxID=3125786 RepID=UPI00324B8F6D
MISEKCKGDTLNAKAFAPAHITGFFETHDHQNPVMKGSTGCGIVLNAGIESTVTAGEGIQKSEIMLNGKKVSGNTISTVIEIITDMPVKVQCQADIPVECGLGASGAGALSTAYALNSALSLNLTANKLNEIAHVAEVRNSSGLGDVAAQSVGGVVIRTVPGAPDSGKYDHIPGPELDVYCLTLGKLSTGSVLGNAELLGRINYTGRKAMEKLMQKPTIAEFMACSRDFCIDTGLADERIIDIIETVEAAGGMASQAMLGNTVFAISNNPEEETVQQALTEFGNVLHYKTSFTSIRII